MQIHWQEFLNAIVGSVIFSIVGMVFFAITFLVIEKVTPFSIRKEIEEDQNTALGIVLAALIIGVAMIISAAMHG